VCSGVRTHRDGFNRTLISFDREMRNAGERRIARVNLDILVEPMCEIDYFEWGHDLTW